MIARHRRVRLTMDISVFAVGIDPFVSEHLYMFATCPAIQLICSGHSSAHSIRQAALLIDVVLKVWRGLFRDLFKINRQWIDGDG